MEVPSAEEAEEVCRGGTSFSVNGFCFLISFFCKGNLQLAESDRLFSLYIAHQLIEARNSFSGIDFPAVGIPVFIVRVSKNRNTIYNITILW